jgi:hypothetical protein
MITLVVTSKRGKTGKYLRFLHVLAQRAVCDEAGQVRMAEDEGYIIRRAFQMTRTSLLYNLPRKVYNHG